MTADRRAGTGTPRTGALEFFLALVLGAMMLLPLVEALLRRLLHTGISNQTSIVQHLTLVAGMAGAAIAAREGRLLSLGSLDLMIRPAWRPEARLLGGATASAVAALLCWASIQFVRSERGSGAVIAWGVPVWTVQLALPIGFGLIAFRLLGGVADRWRPRALATAAALAMVATVLWPPVAPSGLVVPAFVLLAAATALGLLTGAGSLGLLLPPCLPLIFYAVVAGVDIRDMFLGGIVPGLLLVVLTAAWGISQAPRDRAPGATFSPREVRLALWDAKWEVAVPFVALGAMFSGLATPVEAAALTAFYAFVVETLVYRDLRLVQDTPRVVAESGVLVGGVLLILGVALGFTNYLAFAEVPARAVDWVTASVHSKWMFLLYLNLFLLVVGMLMDIYSAIVVVVPLIVPLGRAFGIDPVHLGIVFLANLELGYLTPPVGQNLFLSSLRFNQPMSRVFRSVIPMLLVFLIGVFVITYVPALTTTLPRWLAR